VTSGGRRGTIGSASPRNRGNPVSPPRHACEGRHRTSAGTPAARLRVKRRVFVCLRQPSYLISRPCRAHFPNDPLPPLPPLTPTNLTPHTSPRHARENGHCTLRTPHPRLVMPAMAGIALQLVCLRRSLRVEQELSSACGSRVTSHRDPLQEPARGRCVCLLLHSERRAFDLLWRPSYFSFACPRARRMRARTAKLARRAKGRMPGVKEK
jgi:hypothetical protein